MESHPITFRTAGADIVAEALPAGALWLPGAKALVVSDLHLGKAERIARREGRLTPPYEVEETLTRLADLIDATAPATVVCLGDSFDDDRAAATLEERPRQTLAAMMAGRRWIWIAGNHDPAPPSVGGEALSEAMIGGVVLRHIAKPGTPGPEASGHYHPKTWLRGRGRPSFIVDGARAILPAFGAYTGGLDVADAVFDDLTAPDALVLMTGRRIIAAPRAGVARARAARRSAPMRAGVAPPI